MSIMSEAIGGFKALRAQAKFYKMSEVANQGKALAQDVVKRSGGGRTLGWYAAGGAAAGGAIGGTYNYYNNRGTMRGAITGAALGALGGSGYALSRGIRSSAMAGGIRDYADTYRGQYAAGMKDTIAGRMGRANRMSNIMSARRARTV